MHTICKIQRYFIPFQCCFDTTLSQIQLSTMHEITSINVTETIFGSDNKVFNSLLRRACHICHNTRTTLVKYRCMRPHQYSCLQMLPLTNGRRAELLFLSISVSVVIVSRTCCQNLKNCISVVMSRELCNVSASTFICGIIFKMKGLKKLKFTSLEKECSAMLNFIKKIQVQKKQGMKIVFSFWHSN